MQAIKCVVVGDGTCCENESWSMEEADWRVSSNLGREASWRDCVEQSRLGIEAQGSQN
jgi:hypothetical protein